VRARDAALRPAEPTLRDPRQAPQDRLAYE
jgi:hypothetical protein